MKMNFMEKEHSAQGSQSDTAWENCCSLGMPSAHKELDLPETLTEPGQGKQTKNNICKPSANLTLYLVSPIGKTLERLETGKMC